MSQDEHPSGYLPHLELMDVVIEHKESYMIIIFAKRGAGIFCKRCGMTSYNQTDMDEKYCGNCHAYHS